MIYLFYICLTIIININTKPKNLMKKNFTFFALATMMMLGMSSVFYACSSDDDNNGSSQQEAGDKAVAELKEMLFDKDGTVIFGDTETPGVYEIAFDEQSNAVSMVALYLNNADYKGGNAVYELADNRGKVTVTEGAEAGIYYQVLFKVKGIPTMTLLIEEPNYMMGKENKMMANNYWKCHRKSGCTNPIFPKPKDIDGTPNCTKCGSPNDVKPYPGE